MFTFLILFATVRFHMSMMEIYNEAVYDLLSTNSSDKDKEGRRNNTVKTSLDIRQNAAGGTSVQGLTEVGTHIADYGTHLSVALSSTRELLP